MPSLPDRPRALTREVQQKIIEYIADGNYFETACRAAGISKQAVEYWRKLVEEGAEHAQVYVDFFDALARAEAIAEVNAVSKVVHGSNGWQGPGWFLERRYPKRWLRKERPQKLKVQQVNDGANFESVENPRDKDIQASTETEGVREE